MLRILGSNRKLCEGLTRREMLRVGGLGLAGLGLADVMRLQHAAANDGIVRARSFGKAKSLILLHLYGAPSQMETVDPKPNAPVEIRGDLGCIDSSLPGMKVCELLPNLAKVMDRTTTLRSLTHPYPLHGVAFALTGVPAIDVAMELSPRDPRHWPYFGSVVEFVDGQQGRASANPAVPANIALPWAFSSQRVGEVPRAGPYAAFLGSEYNPVWTEFVGTATKALRRTLAEKVYDDNDPYIGLSPDSHFVVPSATTLQPDVTIDRLSTRRSLLGQLEDARPGIAAGGSRADRYQQMAYSLLESDALRTALDVRREEESIRGLYGATLFGQACLAARRLVEAGTRVVSVFWDEYGLAGSGWDTHWNHYPRMKVELCPGLDQAWYGLITDLDQRGLLDDTLVVCTSEHGRTPQINSAEGGGRDHWSRVYSSMLAGGGIARGRVVGASDKHGSDPADLPLSPKDMLATMYHLLGIDHHTIVHDALTRPLPLVEGNVIEQVLA
jgi:hypothetical protein